MLADLGVLLVTAAVFAAGARRLRQPAVLGEIIAGIALGPSVLGLLPGHLPDLVFPAVTRPYLHVLSQLGLMLFMFGIGYELRFSRLRGAGQHVTAVSRRSRPTQRSGPPPGHGAGCAAERAGTH